MFEEDIKIDRIGMKLWKALWRCMDLLTTDNLCLVLAHAYRLLDEQERKEKQEGSET